MASTPILDLSLNEETTGDVKDEILPFLQRVYNRQYTTSDPGTYSGGDFRLPSTSRYATELYKQAKAMAPGKMSSTIYANVYEWVLETTGNIELQNVILLPVMTDSKHLPIVSGSLNRDVSSGTLLFTNVLNFIKQKGRGVMTEYLEMLSFLTLRYSDVLNEFVATTRRDVPSQLFSPINKVSFAPYPNRESLMRLIVNGTQPILETAPLSLPQALVALMKIANPMAVLHDISWYAYPNNDPGRNEKILDLDNDIIVLGWQYWDVFFYAMINYEVDVGKVDPVDARNRVIRRVASGFAGPNNQEIIEWLFAKYGEDRAVFDVLLKETLRWNMIDSVFFMLQSVDDWPRALAPYPSSVELLLAAALRDEDEAIVSSALTNLTRKGKFSSTQIRNALWIIGRSADPSDNLERALEHADAYGLIDPKTTRFESQNGVLLSLSEFAGTIQDVEAASTVLQWALRNGTPYPRSSVVQTEWLATNKPLWNTIVSRMNSKRTIADFVDDAFEPY